MRALIVVAVAVGVSGLVARVVMAALRPELLEGWGDGLSVVTVFAGVVMVGLVVFGARRYGRWGEPAD